MMTNQSSAHPSPAVYLFVAAGSADHLSGIAVNCWALWVIVSGKWSLIESEMLTLNLVIMETAVSVSFCLFAIHVVFPVHPLGGLTNFCNATSTVERALLHCYLCVDRYLAVVHPVVFIRYKQIRYRGACLAALSLIATCAGLANVFTPQNIILLSICSFTLLVPVLSIELFCSLSVLRVLRRPGPGERKEGNQQKMRAAKIISAALIMLVLNVVPFIVMPLLTDVFPLYELSTVAFTLCTAGSSVQALLFLSRSGRLSCGGES